MSLTITIMEKKNFLNPNELFNTMSNLRHQAKENLISLMKENNLTYVHTGVEVCYFADCDTCYCHVYDDKIGCEFMVLVQGVHLTADDKLEFDFDWSSEDNGIIEESECEPIDVMDIYGTVFSLLVRKDGDDFDYKTWLEENADRYE